MSTQMPDLSGVRAEFPALQETDVQGQPYVFFDGPGGTQFPQPVIVAMVAELARPGPGAAQPHRDVADRLGSASQLAYCSSG